MKHHTNGHIYFSIKDDKSVIMRSCSGYDAEKLNFKPEEGQNVLLRREYYSVRSPRTTDLR